MGRNAGAYIVTWDEMLQRFPTCADLDNLYGFLSYNGEKEVVVSKGNEQEAENDRAIAEQ